MAEIEAGIFEYLTSQTAITGLIDSRLYPVTVPQNTPYPAMSYRLVSEVTIPAHDGPLNLVEARVQFDCFDREYAGVKSLARALRRAIDGYRGQMGEVEIHGVFFQNTLDAFEDPPEVYRIPVDFIFMWQD